MCVCVCVCAYGHTIMGVVNSPSRYLGKKRLGVFRNLFPHMFYLPLVTDSHGVFPIRLVSNPFGLIESSLVRFERSVRRFTCS